MSGNLDDITHVIQLAVAPVFLLTAIATLINAMNVRLGRIVDRRRVVREQLRHPGTDDADEAREEMRLLARRSRLVYLSILFAVLSALLVCLVVAMFAMILSLSLFLREIYLAVRTGSHYRR